MQIEERPPPGEKVRRLLENGEENAARELRLQVLWTRQLAEELVAIGAPVVKTIDGCLDPDRAYELLPGKTRFFDNQALRHHVQAVAAMATRG